MSTWICTRQNELTHHGIKGMKWGVRRFQNKDGSLTPAGRRRYDEPNVGRDSKQPADRVVRKSKDRGTTISRESKLKVNNSQGSTNYKIPKNKSLHRLQLEEKYMKNGMTREQAEQAAAKRIRTEKYVAAAAGVTVAACVAYSKYKGYTGDKVFEKNTEFQRIMRLAENAEIREGRQYLAVDKKDKIKYKGLLGDTFDVNIRADKKINEAFGRETVREAVYDVTVKNKEAIKVASRKRSEDAFMKLYKEDAEFRKSFQERVKELKNEVGMLKPFAEKIGNDKLDNHKLRKYGYDIFNTLLVDNDKRSTSNANKFYESLRKQGMNALMDVNDKKYSGYNTKMPIITFDGNFDYVKREMSKSEIMKNQKKANQMLLYPSLMKGGAMMIGLYGAAPVISKLQVDKKVLQYKQDHPNSKMTDKEIREMIKQEMSNELNKK